MSRIITLLKEKNHYLERFYSLNEKHLKEFLQGNFESIDYFYNSREKILEIIRYLDGQMEQVPNSDTLSEEQKQTARESMAVKEAYVQKIIKQDLEVLSCIEATKNNIIKELSEVKKGKRAVGKYKMPNFINRVEEEA